MELQEVVITINYFRDKNLHLLGRGCFTDRNVLNSNADLSAKKGTEGNTGHVATCEVSTPTIELSVAKNNVLSNESIVTTGSVLPA